MNVLIAEDTRAIRMIVAATVANAGHQAIEAGDGCEAVHTFKETGNIDLIIMASHRPELQDYLLGPNAARVVRHANCSVLVVRD